MRKQLAIALLLFAIPASVLATNEGNGNGNGGPEGNGSSQGPAGPQGPVGPQGSQGPQGNAGSNGQNGRNGTDADNRTNYWRGTELVGDFAVRLYDGKRVQLQVFDMYAFGSEPGQDVVGAGRNLMAGGRVVFKLGSSYEEREIAKLKKQLGLR